jgi:toxin YoeB
LSENKVWCPIFTPTFREHLLWWAKKAVRTRVGVGRKGMLTKTEPSKVNKILDLVEVVCQQPFKGIGKPEPLKYLDSDIWSRRINLEHRLVYRIKGDRIYFLQCRYHYD